MKIFRTRRQYPAAPPEFNVKGRVGLFFVVDDTTILPVENLEKIIKKLYKNLLT